MIKITFNTIWLAIGILILIFCLFIYAIFPYPCVHDHIEININNNELNQVATLGINKISSDADFSNFMGSLAQGCSIGKENKPNKLLVSLGKIIGLKENIVDGKINFLKYKGDGFLNLGDNDVLIIFIFRGREEFIGYWGYIDGWDAEEFYDYKNQYVRATPSSLGSLFRSTEYVSQWENVHYAARGKALLISCLLFLSALIIIIGLIERGKK
jgi:hypothetical protein